MRWVATIEHEDVAGAEELKMLHSSRIDRSHEACPRTATSTGVRLQTLTSALDEHLRHIGTGRATELAIQLGTPLDVDLASVDCVHLPTTERGRVREVIQHLLPDGMHQRAQKLGATFSRAVQNEAAVTGFVEGRSISKSVA
ncbi:MAG: hypothetical protein H6837_16315 [Planctomycetes bacterium]|nr:hypothetical protein [Planctomycetota bacterium]